MENKKLYEKVFEEIRRYIIEQKLQPNDKLPTEHEMCEMFGVSRNALREAVKTLEIMGIVKSSPGIGIVVQEYNMDFAFQQMFYFLVTDGEAFAKEILEVRKALEIGFARVAFDEMTEDQMERLNEALDQMGAKALRGKLFPKEDMQFHMILMERVNNKMLNSILTAAWDADLHFNKGERTDGILVYRGHAEIVKALEERNYPRFLESLKAHFSSEELKKIGN